MAEHVERFTGRVDEYERYRLRYPKAVIDLLRERCGLRPEQVVADVGAGTGMLAELFLSQGNTVIAVEPNAAMRAVCDELRKRYARLTVVAAAAESTTLGPASVDFVSVGRAFHWFDRERALAEFRRILKPRGWLTLVSSGRNSDGSEQSKAYEEILLRWGKDYGEVQRGYRVYEEVPALFESGSVVKEKIEGEQTLTLEELVGQTQSLSVAPLPGEAGFEAMQTALQEFFARYEQEGIVRMGTACWVMACLPA